jgi:hypothetical protein
MSWRELVAEKQGVTQEDEQPVEAPAAGNWRDLVKAKQSTASDPYQQPQESVTPFQGSAPAFPEEREETRAAKELPELGQFMETDEINPQGLLYGEDKAKVASIVPALMTTSPEETAKILQENFPNIGISYDPGGNILARNNKTGAQNILNRPGMSQRDLLQFLGITAAFTPAAKASGALLKAGAKVGSKMLVGGAAAATTQAGIEAVQEQAGGDFSKGEVALAGGLGAFAEVLGPAYQAFKETRAAKGLEVARKELSETIKRLAPGKEAVQAIEKLTGVKVGLFKAQQTMQPSTLLKQRLLPQLDAGSQQAAKALEKQNKEVFEATSELINKVAGPEVVETGTKRFRTAAQLAIDAGKEKRKIATKGIYDQAFKVGGDVNLSSTNSLIDDILGEAPKGSDFKKVGLRLQKLISPIREGEQPTLRQLQKAKMSMQDIIDGVGDKAVSGPIKAEVVQVKRELVNQMSKASKLFRAAEDKFMEMSPAVKELEDSLVGAAAKFKDINLQNISSRIFSPNANPAVIKQAKKVIDGVDPGAWDDMMRVEFQRRVGGMQDLVEDLPGEIAGNTPDQLRRAIFGNPEKRRTLLAALSGEQKKNFVYLEDVLRRASAGRQAGSPTEPFKQAIEKMKGAAVVLREYIFKPREVFLKSGERKIFDRNVEKLTDILFDPKWAPNLKELRKLDSKLRGVNGRGTKSEKILRELFDSAKASTQTIGEE